MKRQNRKEIVIMLLSFMIPVIYMIVLYAQKEIYPGGSHTILTYDMQQQYLEFYASLRSIGEGGNSIFFNWNRSLGGNYLGLFAYYLASPFTIITLLCPLSQLPNAIYVMTLLKFGCAGLTFSIFLNHGYQLRKRLSYSAILFSCCYALMSYNVMYSISIMWLDGVILLPLILLGVERLLEEKKGGLFFVTLTMCFISNYYISYMVGIFTFLYLMYRMGSTVTKASRKDMVRVFGRFVCNTIFAAGVSMPLLLPAALDLKKGKLATDTGLLDYGIFRTDFIKILMKLTSAHYDSITYSGLPSIFCGTFTLLMAAVFFLQKKNAIRQRILALGILVFYMLSFWIMPLNLLWHGGQRPACYPDRFAFTFCAFLLILAYHAYRNIDWRHHIYRYVRFAGVVLTVFELALNGSVVLSGVNIECAYCPSGRYKLYYERIDAGVKMIKDTDDSLYRVGKNIHFSINDPMLFGFNGLSCFISTYNIRTNVFAEQMGFLQKGYELYGAGSSVFTDALLGVKYYLNTNHMYEKYINLGLKKQDYVFQNPYALSIGYMVDVENLKKEFEWQNAPFDNQNLLASNLTNCTKTLFQTVPARLVEREEKIDGGTKFIYDINFEAEDDSPIYLYSVLTEEYMDKKNSELLFAKTVDEKVASWGDKDAQSQFDKMENYIITVNGERLFTYSTDNISQNVMVGEFSKGEQVNVRIEAKYALESLGMAKMDMDVMQQVYDELGENQLEVTNHKNGTVEGVVTAGEDQMMLTSIPYDEGFQIYVDGKKTDYYCYLDTFLVVPMEEGGHHIVIKYVSPGFVLGCLLFMASCVCVASYYRRSR